MAGNGPIQFYMVYRQSGMGEIHTSVFVRYTPNGKQPSPYAMVQEDWRSALPRMVSRYPYQGQGLEIDSHGAPGKIFLMPEVNLFSLSSFAAAVRGLLRPQALVEILACRVANFHVNDLIALWKASPERRDDVQFLKDWLENSDWIGTGGGRGGNGGQSGSGKQSGGSRDLTPVRPSWYSDSGSRVADVDHARVPRLAIECGYMNIGREYNGPLFCSRAAQLLGCTVRASMSSQPQDMTSTMSLGYFLNTTNNMASTEILGNWKGHVFDFDAAGGVTWVGHNLPRPVYSPFRPGAEGPLRNA